MVMLILYHLQVTLLLQNGNKFTKTGLTKNKYASAWKANHFQHHQKIMKT